MEPPRKFIHGDLLIRCYEPGDGFAVNQAVLDSYEHLRPWMPWARPDQTAEASEEIVLAAIDRYDARQDFTLGIWRGHEYVGGTGFHLRWGPFEHGIGEIGMWIRGDHSSQGLGTEALLAMLQWGFTEWQWRKLVWVCQTDNTASARVAEKAGMRLDGVLRSQLRKVGGGYADGQMFTMLREEFRSGAG